MMDRTEAVQAAYRALESIEDDLAKAIDQWEPPTAREVAQALLSTIRVLREIVPPPETAEP
jgi:hypothetical protein